jgi:hypothetical protein
VSVVHAVSPAQNDVERVPRWSTRSTFVMTGL